MPIGFFIVPYVRRLPLVARKRYCQIDDHTDQIVASGGRWAEVEVLGNRAIVKVRASTAILTQLATLYKRLPKDRLDDPLSDLSIAARQKIKDELLDMGYTQDEITNFGSVQSKTLRQVLGFMATRRLKARYHAASESIILDGEAQACRPIEYIDLRVT